MSRRPIFVATLGVALFFAVPAHAAKAKRGSAARREPAVRACDASHLRTIRAVLPAALGRIQTAKQLARGDSQMGQTRRQDARHLAQAIFNADLQREGGEQVLLDMQTRLGGPTLQFMCPPRNHSYCNLWDAATERGNNKVFLCPSFFSQSPEQKKRTLIHEAAHLAFIAVADERYCNTPFACTGSCSQSQPWQHADNWAQFVNCATGAPALPQDGITLRARARRRH
jgi:hypothetical protein